MKYFLSSVFAFLLLASSGYAQDAFYYYGEQKIPLTESPRWTVVQVSDAARSTLTETIGRRPDVRIRRVLNEKRGFYWLESRGQQDLGPEMIDQLSQEVSIRRTFPAYYRVEHSDTSHFVMTDEFQVQFDGAVTRSQIDALNAEHGVEVAPFESETDERQAHEYNEYVLRVTEESEYDALEAANRYHENPRTKWASPNFFVKVRFEGMKETAGSTVGSPLQNGAASDPLYSKQYYLHNTSSNLGSADVDIDAPEAWNHTKGSSSITVAVIDAGVGQHEDFYSGQLVNGKSYGDSGGGLSE